MTPGRRIAAHWLWTPQGLVHHPVVTLAADGGPAAVEVCAEPDRLAATEFYAGLLIFDFPADYAAAFAALCRDGRPLPELLPRLLAGRCPADEGCTVVVSGLDYATFRPTPQACIRCIDNGKCRQPPIPNPA